MSKKLFSEEEIELLTANPNVAVVTRRSVGFTDEFKIKALNEYNGGKSARKIFSENGLPVEIIGMSRVNGFLQRISKEPKTPEIRPKQPDSKRIKSLEKRVLRLQQENEFLKKWLYPQNSGNVKLGNALLILISPQHDKLLRQTLGTFGNLLHGVLPFEPSNLCLRIWRSLFDF